MWFSKKMGIMRNKNVKKMLDFIVKGFQFHVRKLKQQAFKSHLSIFERGGQIFRNLL